MLAEALSHLEQSSHHDLLVGFNNADDAGVFRISETQALVQTVDFFTPIVDDPFWFGKIAAANALSDVYAMGGTPVTALSIVCFPEGEMPPEILSQILAGAGETINESGAVLVGGHSVKDKELKYGLSVTGLVDPAKLITNGGAQPGDVLYLTKPLGTGIVSTAIKRDACPANVTERVMKQMATLNRDAAEEALKLGAHAMTDITGFGFLGHALEMARASNVTLEIDANAVPLIPEALEFAKGGYLTGGANDNQSYIGEALKVDGDIDENLLHILFDPQTSGGLLIAAPEAKSADLVAVGNVTKSSDCALRVSSR